MCILERIDEYKTLPFHKFKNQVTSLIAFFSILDPSIANQLSKEFLKIMHNQQTQSEVTTHLINYAVTIVKELIVKKKGKIERLIKVRNEAYMKRIELKMAAIENMFKEATAVRNELIERREAMIAELNEIN